MDIYPSCDSITLPPCVSRQLPHVSTILTASFPYLASLFSGEILRLQLHGVSYERLSSPVGFLYTVSTHLPWVWMSWMRRSSACPSGRLRSTHSLPTYRLIFPGPEPT